MGASHGVPCPMLPPLNLCNICALQADVPIKSAKLLGAHDSGTFRFCDSGDLSYDAPGFTQKLNGIPGVGSVVHSIVCDWGRTQAVDYANMLHLGVRYFDLRLWYSPKGEWVLVHGMVGETLAQAVADVSGFLADYPQEVVILYVKDIEPKLKDLSTEAASSLEQIFLRLPLVLRSAFTVNMPLGEIARIGNVLLAFDADHDEDMAKLVQLGGYAPAASTATADGAPFTDGTAQTACDSGAASAPSKCFRGSALIWDPWCNKCDVDALASAIREKAAIARTSTDPNFEKLFVSQLVLTPQTDEVVRGVKASLNLDKCICVDYPMTLHSICVRGRNGLLQLARSLAEAPEQYRTNIVMVDFVEKFHALFSDFASPVNEVLLDGASYTIRLGGSTNPENRVDAALEKGSKLTSESSSAPGVTVTAHKHDSDGGASSWSFTTSNGLAIDDGGQSRKPMHMWDLMPGNPNQRFLVRAAGNGTCTVHCCRDLHDAWDLSASGELSVMPFNNWPTQKFRFELQTLRQHNAFA